MLLIGGTPSETTRRKRARAAVQALHEPVHAAYVPSSGCSCGCSSRSVVCRQWGHLLGHCVSGLKRIEFDIEPHTDEILCMGVLESMLFHMTICRSIHNWARISVLEVKRILKVYRIGSLWPQGLWV